MPALNLEEVVPVLEDSARSSLNCAVLVERIGPYHFSRLRAAAARMRIVALEFFGMDSTYAWDKISEDGGFQRVTLLDRDEKSSARLKKRVREALSSVAPDVVAIPGWASPGSLAGLDWCIQTGTPSIVLSASSAVGKKRSRWKEAFKGRIVRLFSAGVGGGTPQANYLSSLGVRQTNVFSGYDVVENAYFAGKAQMIRGNAIRQRELLGLPENFFLCVCRFIGEKNLPTFFHAYAAYRRQTGASAWKLVLVGDGPLRSELIQLREALGLADDIVMPGFKQHHELPPYYALAKALVLPSLSETWGLVVNEAMATGLPVAVSTHCGCATDLVSEGRNGFTFSPTNVEEIKSALVRLADPRTDLAALGQESLRIVDRWSPEAFALSLRRAAENATTEARPLATALDKVLLKALLAR